MANDQNIQWLLEGAATWNRRRENQDFEPNLSAANFRSVFLKAEGSRRQSQVVRPVRLIGINLKQADLSNAILGDAVLVNANLQDAICSGAYLYGANLSGSRLDGADLTAADLAYANLTGATLEGANLSRADLTGVDLTDIDLSSTNLDGANLTGVRPVELMLRPSEDNQETDGKGNRVRGDYRRIITIDPHRRFGKPCIRNTRITVGDVFDYLAARLRIGHGGLRGVALGMDHAGEAADDAGFAIGRPQRNSFSRLWPVQISDHSPCTFSSPRSRN